MVEARVVVSPKKRLNTGGGAELIELALAYARRLTGCSGAALTALAGAKTSTKYAAPSSSSPSPFRKTLPRKKFQACPGVFDYAGRSRHSRYPPRSYCLRTLQIRRHPDCIFSELDCPAHLFPCLRFAVYLAVPNAKLVAE
jgi:hypothetical protein